MVCESTRFRLEHGQYQYRGVLSRPAAIAKKELIRELVRHSGNELQKRVPQKWKWYSRHVKLVDGTTLSMPDTPENQAVYPQLKTQQPGVGFPLCRLVGILDLSSGGVGNGCAELSNTGDDRKGNPGLYAGVQLDPNTHGAGSHVCQLSAQRTEFQTQHSAVVGMGATRMVG